jgi:uncharacterized membrane protein YvlD (DUF360 family)
MLRSALILLGTALSLLVIDLVVPGVNIANFPASRSGQYGCQASGITFVLTS